MGAEPASGSRAAELPEEFALLDFRPERWTLADLMAVSRLAATDFTWKVWLPLLRLTGRPDWLKWWERMVGDEAVGVPSFAGGALGADRAAGGPDGLPAALGMWGRSGSNSVAVGRDRTATGGAMIASDPHLSVTLPNLWLIAGIRSPGYEAVGLMLPGVPIMALGRNRHIAWGGTSLHAASSELVDVGAAPGGGIAERTEIIRVRGAADVAVTVRRCDQGPIISDAPLLPTPVGRTLALRWVGHRVSDEMTAMLEVNRARDWDQFLTAVDKYAVPALNMVYADAAGHVGGCMAAHLPRRPAGAPADLISAEDGMSAWDDMVGAKGLPHRLDPPEGVVASANDRPPDGSEVAIGWFFSPADRVRRLHELTSGAPVDLLTLKQAQQDVMMRSALDIRDRLLALVQSGPNGKGTDRDRAISVLGAWDGHFTEHAPAPVLLELLVHHFLAELHGEEDLAVYTNAWEPWALLRQDLDRLPQARLVRALRPALKQAVREADRFATWGDMHRLTLHHPFGRLPLVGRRFRFADVPVGGSNETLMKTAHGYAAGRHAVRLGAVARHVSDLTDPDCNLFVLLGGQDGWLGSTTFFDQFPLWREGRYIRVPMSAEAIARDFPHEVVLAPAPGSA